MVGAEQGQVGEFGWPAEGPVVDMVDLQSIGHVAPGDHAGLVPECQGRAQAPVDGPTLVADGSDVAGLSEDHTEERIGGQGFGQRHRDGTHSVEFAQFTWLGVAPQQGIEVDPDHDGCRCGPVDEVVGGREDGVGVGVGVGVGAGWDRVAVSTAFKITMIEGIEVVFIVVALGAAGTGLLLPASLGAIAALLLVVALGAVLHRPVAMIPENTLKFTVGILLCAFGTFWVGEGIGLHWPGEDLSLLGLITGFAGVALVAVRWCRAQAGLRTSGAGRPA